MFDDENTLDLNSLTNYETYEIKEAVSTINFCDVAALSKGDIIYECFKRRSVKTRIISDLQKGEVEYDGKKYDAWEWKAEILEVNDYKWDNGTYHKIRVDPHKKEQAYRVSNVPCQGQPKLYSEDIYKYLIGKEQIDLLYGYKMESIIDRIKGTIYGQAIGDALGLGTEGMTDEDMAWKYPNGIRHYSDIFQDRHRKRWKIGDWTDDTDMMLCIANAVIKDKGVNLTSIAQNFKDWANGEPMGIGENTYKVLMIGDYVEHPIDISKKVWEMSHQQSAANGGVMRTSIVGLFPKAVEECAVNICRLTHYDPRCAGSCAIVSLLIHSLVYSSEKLSYHQIADIGERYDSRIREYIDLSLNTDIRALELQDWDSVGYTLKTLSAGLWAYWNAKSFEDGLLSIVRAGGDADTNAAVACAILGAKYGFSSIPHEYVDGLIYREQIEEVINGMIGLAK